MSIRKKIFEYVKFEKKRWSEIPTDVLDSMIAYYEFD